MTKAIIFDLDGVIVDTEPLNKICLREFLKTLGVNEPYTLDSNIQGLNTSTYWTAIKNIYGIDLTVEELVSRWRPTYLAYLESLDQIPVIPGIPEFIEYLVKSNYKIAIGSSANPKRIELILDRIQLEHTFSVIVHGDDVVNSKPAPDCFLIVAERLDIDPGHCIVIEDSTNGIKAAKAANMRCIAYGGSDHNEDDQSEADIVINDFSELVSSLQDGKPFPV
jgi:HAD superfamily hydrolase (TIGR01509 family)